VLGGAACGVATMLIRHSRRIETTVAAKAWRVVESPAEAFHAVRGRIEKNRELRDLAVP
jgi:hypothetical protein